MRRFIPPIAGSVFNAQTHSLTEPKGSAKSMSLLLNFAEDFLNNGVYRMANNVADT